MKSILSNPARTAFVLLLALVGLPLILPAAYGADLPESAERFCTQLFDRLDNDRIDETFDLASPSLDMTRHEFLRMMSERESMGQTLNRTLAGSETVPRFADLPDGRYLMIVYDAEFEAQPEAKEVVVLDQDENGAWGLAGYRIDYNRWPEALRMIATGIIIVFFIMILLAFITWAVGRVVQSSEKKKKARAAAEEAAKSEKG